MHQDPQTFALIGAGMEVHKRLGPGFLEHVYQEALAIELQLNQIPHQTEVALPIRYRGELLQSKYRADFVCFDSVVVELKALKAIAATEVAQCINYLKASGYERCLLLNFGAPRLEYKRLVLTNHQSERHSTMEHPTPTALHLRTSASSADQN